MKRRRLLLRVVLPVAVLATAFAFYTPDISRDVLEARYLDSPAQVRTIAGTSVHVRESGPVQAPALILLHGMGASLHTWEPWARALFCWHRVRERRCSSACSRRC